jgi:hypothetical protein
VDKRKNVRKYIENDVSSPDQRPNNQKTEDNIENIKKNSKYSEKKEAV